jgi:hypothetical protein
MSNDLDNQPAATTTAGAPGEPVSGASALAQPVSSGSTSTQADTLSTVPASIQTTAEAAIPPVTVVSTTGQAGTAGEQGNASGDAGSSEPSSPNIPPSLSDSLAADAASRVLVVPTPPTDSQTGSPTGGPIVGRGDTLEAKTKHGVLDRIEEDLRAELHVIEGLPNYVLHVLSAVFDRHHSRIDTE